MSGSVTHDYRTDLMRHALELFAARGFDAVGVQEIVDKAGVTKPTLYHYFGSKQGLLRALLDEHFKPMDILIRGAAFYRRDLTRNLDELAITIFRYAEANPAWYRMQLSLWFAPRESEAFTCIQAYDESQHQMVEELFLRASADHGNMRGRHRAYAATFMGMLNTYIGLWLNGYIRLDDGLARKAVHQFAHGIYS
jgi:TetR/AcrR family transcriptional regulator